MSSEDEGAGGAVRLVVQPEARLWVAVMLGVGGAVAVGAALLLLGELFASMREPILDALIQARIR